ncbi:MAG: excinuclease ABC subunit UvrA, partial [Pirellulales bacterium]|nr:excinuclease ABC subunit UvrA [Pirellulales bacterium]
MASTTMRDQRCISLRGVEVHNLDCIDLDIPHRKLVVVCGVSGSGKSSLAIDTLYAEGQRRYIESFSTYTRQFLERLERPDCDHIEGIPPAIAVSAKNTSRSSRATVGTATETTDFLRLLLAKIGQVFCLECGEPVRRDSPQSAADQLETLPPDARFLVAYSLPAPRPGDRERLVALLKEDGFHRLLIGGQLVDLAADSLPDADTADHDNAGSWHVIVDRLRAGDAARQRLCDSLETALAKGHGACQVLLAPHDGVESWGRPCAIAGQPWRRLTFSTSFNCANCGIEYPPPEPRLFSFNSPLGACPQCEGFGNVIDLDLELVVPDPSKSIREGAIAPWNSPAYSHELDVLMQLADEYDVPVDVPFAQLDDRARQIVLHGVAERKFGGLVGFFDWLQRRKYKMHVRVFLSRWRSYRTCPTCNGTRLRREALATRVGGRSIADICSMKVRDAADFFRRLELDNHQRTVGRTMLEAVQARLDHLETVGLGYLTLDRTLRTLSGGETRRVALTSALSSNLVNMLYVLDEPSVGLHPRDIDRLIDATRRLRDRLNTVVVVEHEEAIIRAADQVIEFGPGAGQRGGQIVFQGTPEEMQREPRSLTGDYLAGRRGIAANPRRREPDHGWIRLAGARGNNLQNITVEFPLGMLCLVTGVSGSGKSTLVQDTLYPALCRRLRKDAPKPYPHDDVFGDGQLDDVILVDQSPIGRSPRSNPVTYLKAFDEIRSVFAEMVDARTRGLSASHFSFNVDGGRCPVCQGDGYLAIDMQFLADVYMKCTECGGTRYRREILDVKYRGRNIAEVLDMTVREAFTFFRGRAKVQARLKRLIDVGLEYVRLGQPANTLSGGEAQRLKLAAYLSATRRGRSLFILDEPTTGLHFADVVQLLDCFDALLAVGHSLIVVEHNLQMMKMADYIIDLGPGAADEGGRVVAKGTPEMIARN